MHKKTGDIVSGFFCLTFFFQVLLRHQQRKSSVPGLLKDPGSAGTIR